MPDQSSGFTPYRRRQVGGLLRYLRPLGSTWLIAALGVLVLLAGWVLYGMGPATLATAGQALATPPRPSAVIAAQRAPRPVPPSDTLFEYDPPARPDIPATAAPATAAPADAPRASEPARVAGEKVWLQVTAYCPCSRCCGPWAYRLPRRFADGTPVAGTDFALAADTGEFPFGTRIRVPGYASGEPVPVLDVGAAVKGRHIEIFLHGDNAHRRAKQWGNRWMEVEILDR